MSRYLKHNERKQDMLIYAKAVTHLEKASSSALAGEQRRDAPP